MPHDKSGAELHVGDRVNVLCIVKKIELTEEYCNVSLETVDAMFPGDGKSALTLNAKQTEKVGRG
jgi:hypothetical protein